MKLRASLVFLIALVVSLATHADCVVLLHGLARTADAMEMLESKLNDASYDVANIDYPSREMPVEALAPLAVEAGIEACAKYNAPQIHFVTHSMGGILLRVYLASHEIENLGRAVMLAPPNQGSEVVDNLKDIPGYEWINGPAGMQLGTDENSIPAQLGPVDFPLGVIAGTTTFNPLLSQFLPNPDDGKVSVASTKVEGMSDFREVAVSHPFIMRNDEVIDLVLKFLTNGSFGESKKVTATP